MRRVLKLSAVPAVLLALMLVLMGADGGSSSRGPDGAPGLARAIATQEQHTDRLLAIRGVVGTAVSDEGDNWVVKVFTDAPGVRGVPRKLGRARRRRSGHRQDPRAPPQERAQPRPRRW